MPRALRAHPLSRPLSSRSNSVTTYCKRLLFPLDFIRSNTRRRRLRSRSPGLASPVEVGDLQSVVRHFRGWRPGVCSAPSPSASARTGGPRINGAPSCSRPPPSRLREEYTHFGGVSQHSRGARLCEQLVLLHLMSVGKVTCEYFPSASVLPT